MSGRLKITDLLEAERRGVLFLDLTNTTCSQMADGFASYLSPSSVTIFSAGLDPQSMNAITISVMKESGINISNCHPKGLDAIDMDVIAVVVSLCEGEALPAFPKHVKHLSIPLQDPATKQGVEFDLLETYRISRNQVRELVSTLL